MREVFPVDEARTPQERQGSTLAGEDNRNVASTAVLSRGLASLCAGVGQGVSMLVEAA
ncbi:hypothetical protein AB0L63_06370 [Nocardia sp. NPDC051990]|uniref:hypothetical protein n=1 Tax=Nocardia sp. NPDC051990 TaxID=3155285 RepID=UPI003422D65F